MLKMFTKYNSVILTLLLSCLSVFSDGQVPSFKSYNKVTLLPFPACRADDVECLRRGLRTFFFLMDSGYMGMTPVDPLVLNSISVALPDQQMSFLLRKVNVTGAKWTKLIDRKFHLSNGKNGVRFKSDLHIVGELTMNFAGRLDPYFSQITIDLNDVESNVTYLWSGQKGYNNEDYILIGQERIGVRNSRTPSFFLQPRETEDAYMIERVLTTRQAILDHLANEVTIALMHAVVDNFRIFASQVPVKNYYIYSTK